MNENLKFIVKGVNEILGKNYNLIGFNALSSEDLLQILSDVLAKIQDQDAPRIDIRTETPEQSYIRVFSVLRILKYQPQTDAASFRQGLIRGDADTIHPILSWLLSHKDVVKQRAYLSRFLVKVDIPPDCLDADMSALHEQYLNLVEQFKTLHKEREVGKKTGETAAELTADLQAMAKEKEVATMRIEKMKAKAASAMHLLHAARMLREEKDRERDLALQKEQEKETLSTLQTSLQRTVQELQMLRRDDANLTPQVLVQNVAKEIAVQTAIATEKLPAEITARKNQLNALSTVKQASYLGPDEITTLRNRLDTIAKEVQGLIEAKIQDNDSDKMELFRQQAAAVANMKHNVLERLEKTESFLKELQAKLRDEKEQSKYALDEIVPKGEEFKKYVTRLKNKSTLYKSCRAELAGLKAENGVLRRTLVILDAQVNRLNQMAQHSARAKESIPEDSTTESVISRNKLLSESISILRSKLAPTLNEVRALRQKSREIDERYRKASKSRNMVETSVESTTANLSCEAEKIREKLRKNKEEKERLEAAITRMKSIEERILKSNDDGTKSREGRIVKSELSDAIAAEERATKSLKIEEQQAKEHIDRNRREIQQWNDIAAIFACKFRCAEESKQNDGVVVRTEGVETLVLQ